ncbi:MEDS domain-containing protein [Pseudonocardia acidicola]|uniref:MEDS domain-containing protein n=1 Tax=Pseudonocardia acidicola TaxID=2724939 RepID=A0ABX1S8U0_9PSEU|nr:MEDS domain-containing protein [Pseudonocardia acidicola]NMH96781.1 hypothetical protein [Pseudonocardia acidicola]
MTPAVNRSEPGPVATIAGLPLNPHDHLCVLYRGESQRDELMVDFLAEGVEAGHKCYCMIAPTEHGWIASAVSERGGADAAPDDDAAEIGELEFTEPSGSHLQTGGFASERMLKFWDDWGVRTYEQQHRTFARIGADMSWAKPLIAPDFIEDLARYESRFNLWSSHYPQVTACMYDLDKFGGEVVVPVIMVHPKVWMDGIVLENPYYLDSEYLLADEIGPLTGEKPEE